MNKGLHFLYPILASELSARDKEILSIVKPAGVFLDARSFAKEDKDWIQKFSDLRLAVSEAIGRKKVIFAIDHEGGRINRLPLPVTKSPFNGALADYADLIGNIHGLELSALGINLNFAPVADINSNPSNPVIGPRAFGNFAEVVSSALSAYTKALQSHKVAATWKHFPGHGDTEEDSHHCLPVVNLCQSELEAREIKPYYNLNKDNVSAVMTAHVFYSALDEKLPATLSEKIINNLLRKKLKYSGLVVTDDLDMQAITDNFTDEEVVINIVKASVDLMLFNHNPERVLKYFEIINATNFDLQKSQTRINKFLGALPDVEPLKIPSAEFFSINQEKINKLSNVISKVDYFGNEPKPLDIKPPKKRFKVRIGIVLSEDEKSCIKFTPSENSKLIDRNLATIDLEQNRDYQIKIENNELYFFDGKNKKRLETVATIKAKESKLSPKVGTTVHNVIAGRHFHWRKEVSETFSGDLEFIPYFDRIVLVNTVDFEDYVTCVVGSEMSGKNLPADFAKAQAVAARTWSYVFMGNKYPDQPYTLCNDDMSQRYQGSSHISQDLIDVINESQGEFLVDSEGYLCPCFYSKSTGGHRESAENCFGFSARGIGTGFDCPKELEPKLNLTKDEDFSKWLKKETWMNCKIFCSPEIVSEQELKKFIGEVDESDAYFRWEYKLPLGTLKETLKNKFNIVAKEILDLIPGKRGVSGRYLDFKIVYNDLNNSKQNLILPTQFSIRAAFHKSFLYSSAFNFEVKKNKAGEITEVDFKGAGWGHGVGLCQIGSLGMALEGYSYKDILLHYYSKSKLTKAY